MKKPGFLGWVEYYMAPIMFTSLVMFLLLGYPVAFALAACGLFYAVVGIEMACSCPTSCRPCRNASMAR